MNRVALDVGRLAGIRHSERRRPWSSIAVAVLIDAPLVYLTFHLVRHGFSFYALLPGPFAVVLTLSLVGMLLGTNDEQAEPENQDFVVRPPAGDINAIDNRHPESSSRAAGATKQSD